MEAYKRDECDGQVTELARRLDRKQPSISDFLNRRGGAAFSTATRFANLINKRFEDVIGPEEAGTDEDLQEGLDVRPSKSVPVDMPAGTFLLKLADLPGLKTWVHEHPQAVTITDLVRGILVLESGTAAGYARVSDQHPHAGWDTFFRDVRAGKFDVERAAHHGSAARVRATELAELDGKAPPTIHLPSDEKPRKPNRPAPRHK